MLIISNLTDYTAKVKECEATTFTWNVLLTKLEEEKRLVFGKRKLD